MHSLVIVDIVESMDIVNWIEMLSMLSILSMLSTMSMLSVLLTREHAHRARHISFHQSRLL